VSLSLPADLEPFLGDDYTLHSPGVYCLTLTPPDDPAAAWDRHFDVRPDWFADAFAPDIATLAYVGATADVLARLEDHRDGEVRRAALLRVCDIDGLHTVWFYDDAEAAFENEFTMAALLRRDRPGWFVRQQ
jgi:predicted GIY-YIG superfamily endonuclease